LNFLPSLNNIFKKQISLSLKKMFWKINIKQYLLKNTNKKRNIIIKNKKINERKEIENKKKERKLRKLLLIK
jgi:hypothetical protein